MTITGGIVIAKAGNQGDVQNRAIGPGHNNDDYGTLNIGYVMFYLADGDTDPGHSPVVGGIDGKTFTGTQLEGAEVMGYDHAEFDSRSGTLELIFGPLFTVPAGEPFVH